MIGTVIFEHWRASFPGNEDFYIVVDSGPLDAPDRAHRITQAQAFVDELGPELLRNENVEFAVWAFASSRFAPKTIRLLSPVDFETRLKQIAESALVLDSPTPPHLLTNVMASLQHQSRQISSPNESDVDQIAHAIRNLTHLIEAMGDILVGHPDAGTGFEALNISDDSAHPQRIYLTSRNGRLLFIRVTPRKTQGAMNAMANAITAVRFQIDRALARFPDIEAGLTGIDVVEADETDAATRDSAIASGIASLLITAMLIVAFHGWRVPLLAMTALFVGIAWTFGFLTINRRAPSDPQCRICRDLIRARHRLRHTYRSRFGTSTS